MRAIAKYERYKDTDISWVGRIPENWGLKKNKHLVYEAKETVGKNSTEYTLLSLTLNGVIARDMENMKGKFPAEFNTYKKVESGDLIFCLFDIEETPRTVGIAQQDGMITGAYTVLKCKADVSARFLYYFYLSLDFDKRLKPLYSGLRKVIQRDVFMGIETPIPSRTEQERIVDFLDQKTAEIDAAIAKKQRLIELLKEQKAIFINQAVTKGLNPNAPMRDCSVEWIAKIPEGWKPVRLKFLMTGMDQGWSPQCANFVADEEQWGVLKVGCVNGYRFNSDENKSLPSELKPRLEYEIKDGDVLISRANTIELVGSAACVRKPRSKLLLCDKLYRVRPNPSEVISEYFVLMLRSLTARRQIEIGANGASPSMQNIGQDVIKNLWVAVPPLNEQIKIAENICRIESDTELVEDAVNAEVSSLITFKSSLIAEAVTGKIKI